ncbi:MAG: hypothetical protein ACRYFZ_01015 [Janthinobacterium lividum]
MNTPTPFFYPLPPADADGKVTVKLPGTNAKLAVVGKLGTTTALASKDIAAHPRSLPVVLSDVIGKATAHWPGADVDVTGAVEFNDTYTTNYGDQVQAQLALGQQSLHIDRAILCTPSDGNPILLHSNQELYVTDTTSGLIGAVDNYALIKNANPTFDPAAILDHNQLIDGGIYNGRGNRQKFALETGWPGVLHWWGGRDNTIRNGRSMGGRTFGWHVMNQIDLLVENWLFEAINGEVNTDGGHRNGFLLRAFFLYCKYKGLGDDCIPINGSSDTIKKDWAAKFGKAAAEVLIYLGFDQFGGQSQVYDNFVEFIDCYQGCRVNAIDFLIEDVGGHSWTGNLFNYWLNIENFAGDNISRAPMVKRAHWENIAVRSDYRSNAATTSEAYIRADTDDVGLGGFTTPTTPGRIRNDFTQLYPSLKIEGFKHTTLYWRNYYANDTDPNTQFTMPHVLVKDFYYATPQQIFVDKLALSGLRHKRVALAAVETSIFTLARGSITLVDASDCQFENVQYLVDLSSEVTVDTLDLRGSSRTNNAGVDVMARLVHIANGCLLKKIIMPMGFTGGWADLVCGPGAATVGIIQTS